MIENKLERGPENMTKKYYDKASLKGESIGQLCMKVYPKIKTKAYLLFQNLL